MLITATTTSQNLKEMLSTADLDVIKERVGSANPTGSYLVFIQNFGGQDVYLEMYKDATTTESIKIPATTGEISFALKDLQDAHFITGASTSTMRVLITQ